MGIMGYITLLPSSASASVRMRLQHVMTKVSRSSLAQLSVFFQTSNYVVLLVSLTPGGN